MQTISCGMMAFLFLGAALYFWRRDRVWSVLCTVVMVGWGVWGSAQYEEEFELPRHLKAQDEYQQRQLQLYNAAN